MKNLQGRAEAARHAHNVEVGGAIPSPAICADTERQYVPALVAGTARATEPTAVARVIAELEHAAEFLKSRHIEALIESALRSAVGRSSSPWVDRAGAAAHCRCSVSEIDRAAGRKVFPLYLRGGTPLFKKADLDEAIESGQWPKRNQQNHE